MRTRLSTYGIGATIAMLLVGCGGGSSSSSAIATSAVNPTGKITTFTEVSAMKAGTQFFVILDRPGGKVTAPIKLVGTSDSPDGRIIYFSITSQQIGAGDSGSLIVDTKGNSVGAVASGMNATGSTFSSTAIEDEESIFLAGPTSKQTSAATASAGDGLRRIVQGVSPYIWSIATKDKLNKIPSVFTLDTSTAPKLGHKIAPVSMATKPPYSTTIFMVASYGDAVLSYTTGSITTPYLNKLVCYGRPLNWEGGSQNIPCVYGKVIDFVTDPVYGGSKIGIPNLNSSAGTLVDDRKFGVIVDPAVTATPITVTGTVTLNANSPVTFNGYVSQDADYETSFALMNISQGTENIVNANEIAGSASGSATVNFADGTSTTVDLTDTGSSTLIGDLYAEFEQVLYSNTTFAAIPLSSITFNITLTTG